ncbi:hypothetical protein BU24DRAFT_426432 [Aaosphaeria arxii CBS 175.79]|uniref:BZIP domain-containing protein n=1 Tax=Aaosphaeria arxii CBS 175.79 TaxID=1450172 RepID=A0A6A5XG60_9PLEO|nr:uncharacterized protein BU24DRAFT_426432 [Aaosphaeria arxii CBS 175.79]KAF2011354.1 hypothetical protein BU24DRAFT_426432 [Aaosphaeria arxii CBS 175.79]
MDAENHHDSRTAPTDDRKKLRNRLSQRAFRQRQNAYVKELEEKVQRLGQSDCDKIAELEQENSRLRKQIVSVANKLESVQAHLKTLAVSMIDLTRGVHTDLYEQDNATEDASASKTKEAIPELSIHQPANVTEFDTFADLPMNDNSGAQHPSLDTESLAFNNSYDLDCLDEFDPGLLPSSSDTIFAAHTEPDSASPCEGSTLSFSGAPTIVPHLPLSTTSSSTSTWSKPFAESPDCDPTRLAIWKGGLDSSPWTMLPRVWSYEYQMGSAAYQFALSNKGSGGSKLRSSNSNFSDHIAGVKQCILNSWSVLYATASTETSLITHPQFYAGISLMLSLFNSLNRPRIMSWYAPTKFYHHITDLTIWQICPTKETYSRMHCAYRPTALQLMENYPAIIDWCPFAIIRDKLILLHSANPLLDQIICDIATAYVVQADLSSIVDQPMETLGYIRVWDLINAMGDYDRIQTSPSSRGNTTDQLSPNAFDSNRPNEASESLKLPAPTTSALFNNPAYARLAFEALHMHDGLSVFKLDPDLFLKYPELYDPQFKSIASGTALTPQCRTTIQPPPPLQVATLTTYKHFAEWSLAVLCGSKGG